jgi:pteridine reductase
MSLALLTGATGVLGRELVKQLARDYKLVLHYRSSEEVLDKLLQDPTVREAVVKVVKWDFSHGKLDKFVEEAISAGLPKLVVLSASYYDDTPADRVSEELFNYLAKVNLVAPIYLALKLGTLMDEGTIVILSDMVPILGHEAYPGLKPSIPYVATRGSLHHVVRYLAKELAPSVRVVGVAVGWVDNPKASRELREKALRSTPTRSFVKPEEIYEVIKLAAKTTNMNGIFLVLSGGL